MLETKWGSDGKNRLKCNDAGTKDYLIFQAYRENSHRSLTH